MSPVRRIVFLLALMVMAMGAGYITYYFASQAERGAVYSEIRSLVISERPDQDMASTVDEPGSEVIISEEEKYISPIDFASLRKINDEIYAWIEIEGTDISYPLVQSLTDDSYYLDHTIEGKQGYPGSIYTLMVNSRSFTDFNTVIYGHNMKNGTMFGSLKRYRDESYLKEHRTLRIYTPYGEKTYTVFAAVVFDNRLLTDAFSNGEESGRNAFLKEIKAVRDLDSIVLDDIPVTSDDRIITLSTCISGKPRNRYLVIAVLTDEKGR